MVNFPAHMVVLRSCRTGSPPKSGANAARPRVTLCAVLTSVLSFSGGPAPSAGVNHVASSLSLFSPASRNAAMRLKLAKLARIWGKTWPMVLMGSVSRF